MSDTIIGKVNFVIKKKVSESTRLGGIDKDM